MIIVAAATQTALPIKYGGGLCCRGLSFKMNLYVD